MTDSPTSQAMHLAMTNPIDRSIHAMALAKSRLEEQDARIADLEAALRGLLATPAATQALRFLDRGLGTASVDAAWLRARSVLNKEANRG